MSDNNGVLLMPPPFADGLDVWSREDGTPGTLTYDGAADAVFVPADQDFGGCLEILKTESTQRLRYMGETPFRAGYYIRVTARVKAVSGAFPSVRIGAWAGTAGGSHVGGLVETGPSVPLTSYGEVVTVTAVIGSGEREGVDMVWGESPTYGHFGIDITGPNGGVIRVEDIEIHDITTSYTRDLLVWGVVLDYGAVGDGITDDSAAFEAADAAANGRQVLVPAGLYYLANSVTFESPVRFEGTVTMPVDRRLSLRANYELNSYIAAFGNEELAFKKAFQALLNFTDHEVLDLNGRQVDISAPIDMRAAVDNKGTFAIHRTIRNGTITAQNAAAWTPDVVTSVATYSSSNATKLRNVSNVASIEVGSLVEGTGVGREVYVREKNVGAQELTLSQPLWGAPSTQVYTFTRFKYMIDFSGFDSLMKMRLADLHLQCNGHASAVMLPPAGSLNDFVNCQITRPRNRGITSIGNGCQGMQIDGCRFFSDESPIDSDQRQSIAVNVNGNDMKLRGSWFQHFRHTVVMNGTGHMIVGNHWFQGDNRDGAPRLGGLVFTGQNLKSVITGNYCDNSSIELTNEHDANPDFGNEFSFGGLTITGNIFTANSAANWFRWIIVKPYGTGHYIQGFSVTGNTFRTINGNIGRVEAVDDSIADLDYGRFRNIIFEGNTFNGVTQTTFNPVTLEFANNTAQKDWVLNFGDYLPFGGFARKVTAIAHDGPISRSGGGWIYTTPFFTERFGSNQDQVRLTWSEPCTGRVMVTARVDNPT
jgi:hypothetical protein